MKTIALFVILLVALILFGIDIIDLKKSNLQITKRLAAVEKKVNPFVLSPGERQGLINGLRARFAPGVQRPEVDVFYLPQNAISYVEAGDIVSLLTEADFQVRKLPWAGDPNIGFGGCLLLGNVPPDRSTYAPAFNLLREQGLIGLINHDASIASNHLGILIGAKIFE